MHLKFILVAHQHHPLQSGQSHFSCFCLEISTRKTRIMFCWSSWRRLNKSLGCDGAAVLGPRWAVLPLMPPISSQFHLSVTSHQAQTPWESLQGDDRATESPPVPHRCVFLIKNKRHLWAPEIGGATWSHRSYSKRLDFLVIIYFVNSLRLWNSRGNLPPKRKPKQKPPYNPPSQKNPKNQKTKTNPLKTNICNGCR